MNVITIELCAEDRARLDKILAALEGQNCQGCVQGAVDFALHKAAELFAGGSPAGQTAPPAPEVSLAEFQKGLALRCSESPEIKAKVKALINEYAEAASAVPAEKRAEVLERLAKL